jgi:hypothetical protein
MWYHVSSVCRCAVAPTSFGECRSLLHITNSSIASYGSFNGYRYARNKMTNDNPVRRIGMVHGAPASDGIFRLMASRRLSTDMNVAPCSRSNLGGTWREMWLFNLAPAGCQCSLRDMLRGCMLPPFAAIHQVYLKHSPCSSVLSLSHIQGTKNRWEKVAANGLACRVSVAIIQKQKCLIKKMN